ncbi:kinase-like domain-containing protein [Cokeromyces recurvatus]|uniref:kinase-like domain-containing protein n=1 Tax=Cokeromyces recurvatus TaxID=90255 RepID=UPI00221EFAFB|nr:kinase-like domain-containing protein [Cokeromyces recurvatus]KAI7904417.1 kinase-like domain-containing protein [Cokeromyces recurvatus]
MTTDYLQTYDTTTKISRNSSTRSQKECHQRYVLAKTIGNYTLQQSIGKGSMGKVKLAVHNVTGEKIAVKIVPRANLQLLSNPTYMHGKTIQQIAKERAREENREVRTIREAHIMMLLRHPNIVGLKDLVFQGPYFYILMDYVNGGQLLHYIVKRQRLSDRRTRLFSRQIVSALDYLHRNSIVHRDLKIENIMIDKSGRHVKIIDFGLSNLFCPERQLTTYCGSLYFAAPELLRAHPYNGPEVDIWSLGVVIYVMATGSVPFDDKSMPGLHEKIKRGHVNYPAHLSEDCKDLLSRIFVTDPSRRIIMTDIIHHPWMNKEASPINNHLPFRKPLSLPLNPKVIERISQGFNLGTPDDIERRLRLIIQSPVYHEAVTYIADCHARRPLPSSGHPVPMSIVYDDPQSVPAAYHPFLSLYYLASEQLMAKELEASHFQQQQQQQQQQYRISTKSALSRKTSVDSVGYGGGGGYSSAKSSQGSLIGDDTLRLLTDIPLSQPPILPQIHASKTTTGSTTGLSAAIHSTTYLSRIQRWLRSSLSQHNLGDNTLETTSSRVENHVDSSDNKENKPSHSNESTQIETLNLDDRPTKPQQSTANNGSKSLFRKLSHVFLRNKNSSKSVSNNKSNHHHTNTPPHNLNTNEEETDFVVTTKSESTHVPIITNNNDSSLLSSSSSSSSSTSSSSSSSSTSSPPPVPPKDTNYYALLASNYGMTTQQAMNHSTAIRKSQSIPPGMSMATITCRQTAHTIDLNTITNIPTPIASKMAKYNDPIPPPLQKENGYLQPISPAHNISRSTSMTSHRRRGSVSKMSEKIGSWLTRSSSLNYDTKLNKNEI